ncbi:polysaccharide deacetylase family sporulation protein PdaB [Amphibacillus marinus]|uniref:Polysaccharide deacetylase family sporulation protein PdaB n=1 Tax=Amphibacillus marinus TaxID=872970 RepID=A0A1H8S642_9BACI|nr:polysaccharide deacetylase family sporulation protein PdaB [Amphibacillus marinus]SEO74006.1 polysaccharide deacetylase family sporulation protein PdaB [Amphibacillus marinus]
MLLFYTIKLKQLKKYAVIGLLSIIALVFITTQSKQYLQVFSSDAAPLAISKGDQESSNVSLTFNITWGDQIVEPILKQLDEHDVRATFFLLGEWAEHHPHLVDKISEAGHEIGMLGYRYTSYLEMDANEVTRDLNLAKTIFEKLGYKDLKLIRTPSGHLNEEVLALVSDQGYDVIQWRINTNDWKAPGVEQIIDTVLSETENGDIILMHASDSATQTEDALATVLPGLQQKGYQFVTVSELITQAEIETKPVE